MEKCNKRYKLEKTRLDEIIRQIEDGEKSKAQAELLVGQAVKDATSFMEGDVGCWGSGVTPWGKPSIAGKRQLKTLRSTIEFTTEKVRLGCCGI